MQAMAKRRQRPAPRPQFTPEQIAKIREDLGLTQEEAGAKVGVTQRAWARYESGDRTPSYAVSTLIRMMAERKI